MSGQHTVSGFDAELRDLQGAVLEMGRLARHQVMTGIAALLAGDTQKARELIESDRRIDRLQQEVEEMAFQIIALRQPVAHDLRQIIAAMRTSNDLERVGDLGTNIAKRVLAVDAPPSRRLVPGLERLRDLILSQLAAVLDAYTREDQTAAETIWRADAEIDAHYTSAFRELLTYMMEDPRKIGSATHLLFCAKNMERIGDHVTNIAETIMYLVNGQLPDEERPKQDNTSTTQIA